MDQFLPALWIKPTTLASVTGPALFKPGRAGEPTLFVCGGDDPQAIILDGNYAGKAFKVGVAADRIGVAFTDVEMDVDFSSLVDRSSGEVPHRSLAITADGLHLIASTKDRHGFEDLFAWNVATGNALEFFSQALIFTRWRLRKRHQSDVIDIFSLEERRGQ